MIPRRLLFVSLAFALFFSFLSTPKTSSQNGRLAQDVLRTIVLKARDGEVKVQLPADMAAGDTISGTVIVEPKGKTETDRAKSAGELNGLVIEVGTQRWPVSGGGIKALVIPSSLSRAPELILLDAKGKKLDSATLPIAPPQNINPVTNFVIPELGQSGKPLPITGPFDGDSSNTNVKIGGTDAKVIAESPRSTVVDVPKTTVGPSNININDNGNSATGSFRGLKIDLTAPKTSLLKGESTELHVEVQGLQGITQPVPVQIQNQTPQNINLTGGNLQNIVINPSQVTTGGTFNWSTNITGTGSGGFNITGTISNTASTSPSPSPITSNSTAMPAPSPAPSTGATGVSTKNPGGTTSPSPSPAISPQVSAPDVRPTEPENFYASFASAQTDCCNKLINGGVLTLTDENGNSFTIDHDKLKMTVNGKTSEWQFSMNGKPLWIEWMFCHLNDHQIVSQLSQVLIQRTQGGISNDSGSTTGISMAGPYRDDKTKRPSYGFQFFSQKIGTKTKEFGVALSIDAETCAWSCQLIADGTALGFRTNPARSTNAIFNGLNQSVGIPSGATAYQQQAWWNAMYSYLNEIADWYLWLDGKESDDLRDTNENYNMWRAKLQLALVQMLNSAGPDDKSLINQMLGLLQNEHPSPEQIKEIWLKFDGLHLRYGTKVPNDVRRQIMSTP